MTIDQYYVHSLLVKNRIDLMQVNLRSFKQKVRYHQKSMKRFLGKIEKNPPKGLDKLAEKIDAEVWKERFQSSDKRIGPVAQAQLLRANRCVKVDYE